ncbi:MULTISPECIES: hypothetical protein [Emticicia]|uniref:hypothetical protein n=1 Tax=Emticicia TaxID=312278 RepID=UPI0020A0F471|nr:MULTISPECIES: hypothetical protein [Emticicia]UTA68689.1 hypothetical protein MB380_02530 [Emticicia sp. 21SJ11W-3]
METNGTHWVIVADNAGIASVFPNLKDMFHEEAISFITLVYYSWNNEFSFSKEIEILKYHYPGKFIAFYEVGLAASDFEFDTTIIENVINANTSREIRFLVSGCEEFNLVIEETLQFLDIKEIVFQEQFFKNN